MHRSGDLMVTWRRLEGALTKKYQRPLVTRKKQEEVFS